MNICIIPITTIFNRKQTNKQKKEILNLMRWGE